MSNKNAVIDGRWDAARKLGNRNQYNPFSRSWKDYELAFGNQETISTRLDAEVENDPALITLSCTEIAIYGGIVDDIMSLTGSMPYIEEWKKAKTYFATLS